MEATPGTLRGSDPVDDGEVGVYLHLPFCQRICPYCDFAVVATRTLGEDVQDRYVDHLLAELQQRRGDFAGRSLASLYFGGGTPSLFSPSRIQDLIQAVCSEFSASTTDLETTLEVNPSTTEAARLPDFRDAGVNRLSIGIQSFDDRLLKRLGRAHGAAVARETLERVAQAGFENWSLDLIFAGPGQTEAELERDLDELLQWAPPHVSTYELTFEPETPFGKALAAGKMEAVDEDRSVAMIEFIEVRLADADYERYEISSYARPGYRARHNTRYWNRAAVLGLGMGAHSTEARSPQHPFSARRANPRDLRNWQDAVEAGVPAGTEESIAEATARGEAIFLGLRTREGVDIARFESEFGGGPRAFFGGAIDALIERGLLEEMAAPQRSLRLTRSGRLLADTVAAEFVGDGDLEID